MVDYEERFVAFVDILGFEDLIYRSTGANRSVSPAQIKEALQTPEPVEQDKIVLGRIGDISDSGHRMVAFSDSVVITTNPTEQGLMHMLHHIEKIGFRLLKLGFLCRGGISRGFVYHQDEMIFGPAMISAYRLEQEKADMPRVILHDDVVRVGLSAKPPIDKIFNRFTRKDVDRIYFVNILRIIRMIMDTESGPTEEFQEMCNKIEKHLLGEISRIANDERKLKKVKWFKKYFDWARDRSGWDILNEPFPRRTE